MSTLGANVLTLADWAKRKDPNGNTAAVVEALSQTNDIITDMVWKEGNLETGHRVTVRKSLPTPSWRRLNQGVNPTKSTTEQIDEHCGMLEDWCEIDKDVAELNGNTMAFKLSEASAHFEGLNQEFAATLLYGNHTTAQEEFTGIAPRYASPSGDTGENVIDAAGAGADNTSILLVGWGQNTVHGIFPKGSKAGIIHEDLGLSTVQTANGPGGGKLRAYVDHWQWKCGLAVPDWRYIVRIGSIDVSALVADGAGSSVKIIEMMLKAVHRLPSLSGIRPSFYMNRTVAQMLDIQSMNKANVYLQPASPEGVQPMRFRGIPIRTVDAIAENEALV